MATDVTLSPVEEKEGMGTSQSPASEHPFPHLARRLAQREKGKKKKGQKSTLVIAGTVAQIAARQNATMS